MEKLVSLTDTVNIKVWLKCESAIDFRLVLRAVLLSISEYCGILECNHFIRVLHSTNYYVFSSNEIQGEVSELLSD